MLPPTAIRSGGAAGIKPWLFPVATRVVLCCNDTSADRLLQGLDVGMFFRMGSTTSVAYVGYREFALNREKILNPDSVCAELPQ